ncbi:MAG: hypothetical protein ACOX22_00130 [Caldicoprobacterales bacterium]|jgi:hypothetical protein
MKKLLIFIITTSFLIGLSSCSFVDGKNRQAGKDPASNENLEGSLEEILDKIYETANLEDSFREWIQDGLMLTEISEENCENYFGTKVEFESGIASEPIMMPSAYLLCLIRVNEGADIEKIKAEIKEKADPMRWICVGVDPSNIYVSNVGDVIMLVMSDEAGKELNDAFLALK